MVTTQDEYQKHIEKDALVRRFAKVTIEEPTVEDSIAILTGLKGTFEKYHRVRIGDAAVETAVTYAKRYLTSKTRQTPAIDLLDEASATVQNRVKGQVEETGLSTIDKALMAGKYKTVSKLGIKTTEKNLLSQNDDLEVTEDDILETL